MTRITFEILGRAEPSGSKRAFVVPGTGRASVVDANPRAKSWKQEVRHAASQAYDAERHGLLDGALRVSFVFAMTRPKSHFRTGKNAHLLRDAAPVFPVGKPDLLKLARAVEDALTGVIYRDDAQIVVEELRKEYGDTARTVVSVNTADSVDEC